MSTLSSGLKAKYSLYSALAFFLIANPFTYRFTNSLIGSIAVGGCPTAFGLILHTVIFFFVLYGLMSLPHDEN